MLARSMPARRLNATKQKMKTTLKSISLMAALALAAPVWADDKKPEPKPAEKPATFDAAAQAVIAKVRKELEKPGNEAKAFGMLTDEAQKLIKLFPENPTPYAWLIQGAGRIADDKKAAALRKQAEDGVQAILKKEPTNGLGNQVLIMIAEEKEGEAAMALLKQVAANTKGQLHEMAIGQLKKLDALGKPLPIKFTAIDGREIDLTKMKGKVVLVDFWATWCGPCVAEIPNVVRAYNKLHPQGFEIVGISLERDKDPKKLAAYVKEKKMPWAQYHDGLFWDNKFVKEYGVDAVPAMWLIDKKGNLVDMNARTNLEKKVTKLLAE